MPNLGLIVFPCGGGGNHLRWLLFLDNKYTTTLCDNNLESKMQFIQNNVYNQRRTWNNWLGDFEWQFREELDHVIDLAHDNYNWLATQTKELYLDFADPELPVQHYFHLNLGLNSFSPNQLKSQIANWHVEFERMQNRMQEFPNKKIIRAEKLYERQLDHDLYQEVVEFFEFDNQYQHATTVHEWYHQCRVRSAGDFYNYFTSAEFNKYLETLKQIT